MEGRTRPTNDSYVHGTNACGVANWSTSTMDRKNPGCTCSLTMSSTRRKNSRHDPPPPSKSPTIERRSGSTCVRHRWYLSSRETGAPAASTQVRTMSPRTAVTSFLDGGSAYKRLTNVSICKRHCIAAFAKQTPVVLVNTWILSFSLGSYGFRME